MSVPIELKRLLEEHHIQYSELHHSRTYTAQDTAEATHVPGREMAKSVVIKTDGGFVLAVLPAHLKVDVERLKGVLKDQNARIASESEFASLFPSCEAGAQPPFGGLYGMRVVVDEALAEDEEIVFNAGTHVDAVRMKYRDFERVAAPKAGRFAFH